MTTAGPPTTTGTFTSTSGPTGYETASGGVPLEATRGVRWAPAIGFGFGAALVGGLVWGAIILATGYIFGLVAIIIGLFIGWAVHKGARVVSAGIIALGAIFTLLSIFLGQLTALSVYAAPYGATPLDVIAAYPRIVSLAPKVLLDYVFSMFGVFASARYLWRQRPSAQPRPPYPFAAPFGAPGGVPGSVSTNGSSVHVVERGMAKVAVEVRVAGPRPHTVRASYSTMTGKAQVLVDAVPFTSTRVWGLSKEVHVPLDGGTTHTVSLTFRGASSPQIDVRLDGAPLPVS